MGKVDARLANNSSPSKRVSSSTLPGDTTISCVRFEVLQNGRLWRVMQRHNSDTAASRRFVINFQCFRRYLYTFFDAAARQLPMILTIIVIIAQRGTVTRRESQQGRLTTFKHVQHNNYINMVAQKSKPLSRIIIKSHLKNRH